jgi:class 3 adenylate cyclase/predicted ATPase
MDIVVWLRSLGLGKYEAAFRENEIDETVLPSLTHETLKELGVAAVGHRLKLLNAIAALRDDTSAKGPSSDLKTAPAAPSAAPEDRAERRQVTVMFSDLVGSTALSARMDPEDLREVLSTYQNCVAQTVRRFGGFVAQYMGDGVLVYFGYPDAHEDDAERAVQAGLELIGAVRDVKTHATLETRIGIATGLVIAGDLIGPGSAQEQAVVGETPNLAARLQGLAEPNAVVIAEGTRKLLGNLFEFQDLGAEDLKGIAGPVRAFAVVRPSSAESRFEALHMGGPTELVGREEELKLLLRQWSKAKASDGQVVLLSGEGGIGKSRLAAALMESVAGEPHTRLRYFASPHHQDSALYPFITQLERAAGFARDDTPDEKLGKLRALIAAGAVEPDEMTLIAELLSLPNAAGGLDMKRKREKLLAGLLHQLEALAQRHSVLMVFEDAHWIDPTSRDLIDLTVDRIRRLPVLLLIIFRPEFQPPWTDQPHVMTLALNRLAERDCFALVQQLAGNAGMSSELVAEIVERADGVPLFVEELTKSVVEAGADRGALTLSGVPASSLVVPATLHASLLGRLDRLGPTAKVVAQAGAAIGRDFSYDLVAAAAELAEPELREAFRHLVGSGLVFQRGAPPASEYLFKHALVQDTAYSTLLRGPRQALHRRIGEALEARYPSLVEAQPQIAARHFDEARLVDKAAQYWHRAGKLSVAKSAVREAVAQLRRGLSLLDGVPETRERKQLALDLQITLMPALMGAKGYAGPEAIAAAQRAGQLIAEIGAAGSLLHFTVLYGLWVASYVAGAPGPALGYATEFLALARSQPATGPLSIGHRMLGAGMIMAGEHGRALPALQTAASLYREDEHRELAFRFGQDIGASAYVFLACALWHNGFPDEAWAMAERALAHARRFGHLHTVAYTLYFASIPALLTRRLPAADAFSTELVALAGEHDFPFWAAWGLVLQGWTLGQRGDAAAGVVRMRDGLAALADTGCHFFEPYFLGLLGETLGAAGEIDAGIAAIDDALAGAAASGQRGWNAELYRLRGELEQKQPRPDLATAEACYRTAVTVAGEQATRGCELRAATSLARLLAGQGKRTEARDLLVPIYGWFTEGFGTLDLKEARALLDELAS